MTKIYKPNELQDPPAKDPHHVREVFANEIASIEVNGDVWTISLAVRRLVEPEQGGQPGVERVVTSRAALPSQTVGSLVNQLINMKRVIDHHKKLGGESSYAASSKLGVREPACSSPPAHVGHSLDGGHALRVWPLLVHASPMANARWLTFG